MKEIMNYSDKLYQNVANEVVEILDDIMTNVPKDQEMVNFEKGFAIYILSAYLNLYNNMLNSNLISKDPSLNSKYLH